MASERSVSFKVYLITSSLKPEVRRFGIDTDVVASFTYFKEKLQNVFPALLGKQFSVFWRDEDADEISVSSDEELIIALTEMKSDVNKFYVNTATSGSEDSDEEKIAPEGPTQIHQGVTCDGCNKGLKGFRYKCLQCDDYDLCVDCEMKGFHSEHIMMRMPVPLTWPRGFEKKSLTIYPKIAQKVKIFGKKHKHDSKDEAHQSDDHQHRPYCRGRKHMFKHDLPMGELYGIFNRMGFPSPTNADKPQNSEADPKKVDDESLSVKYLKTIGSHVANLLDPLGIDVDIQISPNKKGKEQEKEKSSEESVPTPMQTDEMERNPSSPGNVNHPEGWTILNQKDAPMNGSSEPSTSTGAIPKQPSGNLSPQKSNMYPNLENKGSETNYSENSQTQIPSKQIDPKIQESLEKMLSMGFQNEGGWLTTLLEEKEGNIPSVFEVLHSYFPPKGNM